MCADAYGSYTGAATTVGDTEGFVQVEVGDIAAELAGLADADHGVEVGAVYIDLAAVVVNDFTDLTDSLFKDTVGRRIGDHDRGEFAGVKLCLGYKVVDIDVALVVTFNHYDFHATHLCRGGVGAVG